MSLQIIYTPIVETSDSFDFVLTRNQIIDIAYEVIGVKGQNNALTAEQVTKGSNLLNGMVKNLAAEEVYLWNQSWINIELHAADVVSNGGKDYEAIRNNDSTADNEPGVGPFWESFWTLLTTTTGAAWVLGQSYVAQGNYFLDSNIIGIDLARVKQGDGYVPLQPLSQADYFALGNPNVTGKPTRIFFRKQFQPEVYLYPVPNDVTIYQVELCVYRYPEDFDIGSDHADFLQEWIEPLYFGLAVRLAPQYGITGQRLKEIKELADDSMERAGSSNHEFGDFFVKPDLTGGGHNNG